MRKIMFLIGVFLLGLTQTVSAQLLMEQSRVTLKVNPGETITDQMALHNTSTDAIAVQVYWNDFNYRPPFNGDKKYLPPSTAERSMADWVSFSPTEFILPPKGKININYTINVPSTASGGYNGVLFFQKGKSQAQDGMGVSLVMRVGSLFFVETKNSSKQAKLDNFQMDQSTLIGHFWNQGNVIMFPKAVHYTLNQDGLVQSRGEIEQIYLPSDEKAEFKVPLDQGLTPGQYTTILTFDLGDNDVLVKEVDFTKAANGTLSITELRD